MAKKSRSKNKRKPLRPQIKSHGSSGLESHRHQGDVISPHHDSSIPAYSEGLGFGTAANGARLYSYNSQAPLTDRNLQTLLEQNAHDGARSRPITLDMDRFTREQSNYIAPGETDNYSDYLRHLDNLLEFGELNPSLDHLSDLTSLDDVCFPDYYDHLNDEEGSDRPCMWPDLLVLEEYISEEIEDFQQEVRDDAASAQAVNFRVPVATHVGLSRSANDNPPPLLPMSEGTPLLRLIRVDEESLMRLGLPSFRVRPKQIHPWQKSEEQIIKMLNNSSLRKSERLCRYTYFREDMEGTIHSPTLSGFVTLELQLPPKEEVLSSLQELFGQVPLGSTGIALRSSSEDMSGTRKQNAVSGGGSSSSVRSGQQTGSQEQNTGPHMQQTGTVLQPPMSKLSSSNAGSSPALPLPTSSGHHRHHSPFWLDILDPLEEEMKVISKTFGLHPLTTEDIFLGEAREKVELFKQYYLLCFTSFDVVYERRKQRAMEYEKKCSKILEYAKDGMQDQRFAFFRRLFGRPADESSKLSKKSMDLSSISKSRNIRSGELCPLNMYMIIFKYGVLTFHFGATPHPINVRRRIRMLKDRLTVSTDWICYGLIDDITDSFAPLIDSIEQEVYLIEDHIMKLNSGDDTDDDGADESEAGLLVDDLHARRNANVFYRRKRSKSVVDIPPVEQKWTWKSLYHGSNGDYVNSDSRHSFRLQSRSSLATKSALSAIVAWKRKGDMLRRIGECRKRVMSVLRLLGSKADVIKGYSKRFSDPDSSVGLPLDSRSFPVKSSLRHEILMYLGDIQDHIVTMVQSLNHYEKLLARSHSNYLALLNIDMTKINNDTNDILGKVTILGTLLLPINVVTGLWGMNCIVPGQDHPGLMWFYGILLGITLFSIVSYIYVRKVTGL